MTETSCCLTFATCFVFLLLWMSPVQCRLDEKSKSEPSSQVSEPQDTSNGSVLESTVFIVGISAGVFGFITISCAICMCVFLIGRHGVPQTLSLKSSQRRREFSVFLPMSSCSLNNTAPRNFAKDRMSFVRTSVRKDHSFQALEYLELEKIAIGPCLGRGASGKVYKGEYAGIPLAIKICDHDGAFLRNGNEPLETYLSRNIHHENVVKTLVNETRKRSSLQASTSETSMLNPLSFTRHNTFTEPKVTSSSEGGGSGRSSDEFSYFARTLEAPNGDEIYRTWIIMEYCEMGSLDQAIRDRVFFQTEESATNIPNLHFMILSAIDIADAMKYLHNQCIVHGDLKAQNVLLKKSSQDNRGFQCKVGDFGLSRILSNKTHIKTFTCGTVSHSAPELFRQGLLTPAADVYSFGILLWELITGIKAFNGAKHNSIIMAVTSGCRPIIPSYCPYNLSRLINECWQDSYSDRPTFDGILDRLKGMCLDNTSLTANSYQVSSSATPSIGTTKPQTLNMKNEASAKAGIAKTVQFSERLIQQSSKNCKNITGQKRISAIQLSTDCRSVSESNGSSPKIDIIPDEHWNSATEVENPSFGPLTQEKFASSGISYSMSLSPHFTLPKSS